MTLVSTGGFLMATLPVLASGYLIYDAPLLRLWFSKTSGYVLYFRIIAIGLFLTFVLGLISYLFTFPKVPFLDLPLHYESAPIIALFVAGFFRFMSAVVVICFKKCNPQWEKKFILKILSEKELDQFIYERIINNQMIMVTLENQKVYMGWPIEAPDNEENKWLRLTPEWSGHRDEKSMITIQVNYSKVMNNSPIDQNYMLIPVEKIVTVQLFDEEIFRKFNSEP